MKYNKISLFSALLATTFVLSSGSVQALDLYKDDTKSLNLNGRVATFYKIRNEDNQWETYLRLSLDGKIKVNEYLTGYALGEFQVAQNSDKDASNETSEVKRRLAYVGFDIKDIGKIDVGRNVGVMKKIREYSDTAPEFSGNTWGGTNIFMTDRTDDVITFFNNSLVDNLGIYVQYQTKKDETDVSSLKYQHGDGYAAAVEYKFPLNISAIAGYSNSSRTLDQQADGKGSSAVSKAAALKFNPGKFQFAVQYGEMENLSYIGSTDGFSQKRKILEVYAKYDTDINITPSIGYSWSRDDVGNEKYASVKFVELGASYYLTADKKFYVYADYMLNLLDDNDFTSRNSISSDDKVQLGLIYKF